MGSAMTTYEVGQTVWIYDVNDRRGAGPEEGIVTKVGRTLVHVGSVKYPDWPSRTYRIEDGARNDPYRHSRIRTQAERDERERRTAVMAVLRGAGIRFDHGTRFDVETLEALAMALPAKYREATP